MGGQMGSVEVRASKRGRFGLLKSELALKENGS